MKNDLFYTVPEVASLLRMSTSNVYALVRKNEIPNVKISGRYVIPKDLLFDYLNKSLSVCDCTVLLNFEKE